MKSCKLCWTFAGVLFIVVAAIAYKFVTGQVRPSEDGRLAVVLTKDERNMVLLEMRTWLQNSQVILAAGAAKDFATVSKAATASGMGAEAQTPASLLAKIPLQMKTLGFGTRKKFDEIAADALKLKDSNRTLTQLSAAMQNCVACHASYRLVEANGT